MENDRSSMKNVKKEKVKQECKLKMKRYCDSSDSDSDDDAYDDRPSKKEFEWNMRLLVNNFTPGGDASAGWNMEALESSLENDYLRYFGKNIEPKMFKSTAKTWKEVFESQLFKEKFKLSTRAKHPCLFAIETIPEGRKAKVAKMASYQATLLSDDPIFNILSKLPPTEKISLEDQIAERIKQIKSFEVSKINKCTLTKTAAKRHLIKTLGSLPFSLNPNAIHNIIDLTASDSEEDAWLSKKPKKRMTPSDNEERKPEATANEKPISSPEKPVENNLVIPFQMPSIEVPRCSVEKVIRDEEPIKVVNSIGGVENSLQLILANYNERNETGQEFTKENDSSSVSTDPTVITGVPYSSTTIGSDCSESRPLDLSRTSFDQMFERRPIKDCNEGAMNCSGFENILNFARDSSFQFGSPQACSTQMNKNKRPLYRVSSTQETVRVKEANSSAFSENRFHYQRTSLLDVERYPGSAFEKERLVEKLGLCNTSRRKREGHIILLVDIIPLSRDAYADDLYDIFSDFGQVKKVIVYDRRFGEVEMADYNSAMDAKQRLSKKCMVYDEGPSLFSFKVSEALENQKINIDGTSTLLERDYMYHPRTPNRNRLSVKVILEWDLRKYNEFSDLM